MQCGCVVAMKMAARVAHEMGVKLGNDVSSNGLVEGMGSGRTSHNVSLLWLHAAAALASSCMQLQLQAEGEGEFSLGYLTQAVMVRQRQPTFCPFVHPGALAQLPATAAAAVVPHRLATPSALRTVPLTRRLSSI